MKVKRKTLKYFIFFISSLSIFIIRNIDNKKILIKAETKLVNSLEQSIENTNTENKEIVLKIILEDFLKLNEMNNTVVQQKKEKNKMPVKRKKIIQKKKEELMQSFTAWDFVKKIQVGWNLGNTLDATSNQTLEKAIEYETAWGNPKTSKEMIELVKKSGFQIIRIPVSWTNHISGKNNKISEDWMKRVQEVVDYAIDCDLYVILNLHHEDWYFPSYENLNLAQKKLVQVWGQIAECFKDYDEHLIFEGMNEPRMTNTPQEWTGGTKEARDVVNKLNITFINTIRKSGGNNLFRMLMIPAYAASSDKEVLKDLIIPEDDKIIVSVHAYIPYNFALNVYGTNQWDFKKKEDTKEIDLLFKNLNDLFLKKKIPVIIGEFGALNKENAQARQEWLSYYMKMARKNGVPCIWWDNGVSEKNNEAFALMNRKECKWYNSKLIEILTEKKSTEK